MKTGVLTPDAQVILLLCSHLAVPRGAAAEKVKPLTPSEWNDLTGLLRGRKLRPGVLLDMGEVDLQTTLGLSPEGAERLVQLLARGAQLAFELERLGSLGIWALSRADEAYPVSLKERLGMSAPPVLFGAGDQSLLAQGFVAVVGSRDLDQPAESFARKVGAVCAQEGLVLVSGGARGVDRLSMGGCLEGGGRAIGVLADSLERVAREPEYRKALAGGRLVLVSAVHPKAPFSVASAMARNKFIYCLARYGLVVSSSLEKGGTRAGALEVLKGRWVPLFVREGPVAPVGNQDLIKRGAVGFPAEVPVAGLAALLEELARDWAPAAAVRRNSRTSGLPGTPVGAAPARPESEHDLFPVVWPHLERGLTRWQRVEELAEHLRLEGGQVRAWLDRAIGQGLAVQLSEGEGYGLPGAVAQGRQVRFDL